MLAYTPTQEEIGAIVSALARRSVHAIADELRQGYFTAEGGVRVGVAGRVVAENGAVQCIRAFTSVNIRLPVELRGISRELLRRVALPGGTVPGILIVSPPQLGKTTLLRDVVRAVSDGDGVRPQKCTVIDERRELAPDGFDLGCRTDVFSGCPKTAGMMMALRALSPQVLATDELDGAAEAEAVAEAARAGVTLLATVHAGSFESMVRRRGMEEMLREGIFSRVVLLGEELGRGTVRGIFGPDGALLCREPFLLREEACAP